MDSRGNLAGTKAILQEFNNKMTFENPIRHQFFFFFLQEDVRAIQRKYGYPCKIWDFSNFNVGTSSCSYGLSHFTLLDACVSRKMPRVMSYFSTDPNELQDFDLPSW